MRTPTQRRALRQKRAESRRTLLSFTRWAVLLQRGRGKAVLGENPLTSLAWRTPEIGEAFHGCAEAIGDQCCFGLRHPAMQQLLRKRTRFMGQELVVQRLRCDCSRDHEHGAIEGNYKGADGRWRQVPPALCRAMVAGAEAYLRAQADGGEYFGDAGEPDALSDGDAIGGEEAIEQDRGLDAARHDSDPEAPEDVERRPVPREVQRAVEHAHRQLGHPSRTTLVRMLKMSGATEAAVRHAKRWNCDVCAQRKAPRHPQAAAPGVRPYGFGKHIHIDIKYVYDVRKKKYACLSMLDLGTMKHDAVMVKTRRSDYIARKFFRHWVSAYGPPERITLDQGGEFEKTFNLYLEQMSIPSEVTAAHAGWQLAAEERHGGIWGDMLGAIVNEHSLEGYGALNKGLAAATAAKNSTMTRDGYTPNQRVLVWR